MPNFKNWTRMGLLGCTALTSVSLIAMADATRAFADDVPLETVVVTTTQFNTDAAPAKASLETTEPQTIINRSYIENFVPPQADYVTILSIVPSMTGGDTNGPGLSDGGAKNTLRGLPDGQFVMQYDDIPFGDTNGPTHHNISYFPASTIGSVVVDRGPGNAGNMGASTYGGTVKLFSQTVTDDSHLGASATYGSFNTVLGVLNVETGNMESLGNTKALINLQAMSSDGALTLQDLSAENALLKVENEIAPNWNLTVFGNYSYLREHLDDNNGITPAQVKAFGKNFALQNTDSTLPTYQKYNWTNKSTDMEYIKLQGDITPSLKIDNTPYSYAYWNNTFSPNSQTQTLAQITGDSSSDNGTLTTLAGKKIPNQILAYSKENEYRVWGDMLRLSQDYDAGSVSGQIRTGVWLETQATHRYKFFFDANLCNADDIDPFSSSGAAAAAACGVVKGSSPNGTKGFAKDNEYSDWTQYQPFLEVDIKPSDDLTITPGVKYVHWEHGVNAPVEQGSTCGIDLACPPYNAKGQNFRASFDTTATLPFLQANYKLNSAWSVYAEYAQGIYVPDISAFETTTPTKIFPQAEKTSNYQVGTVYYADNFTFDADLYYIKVNNNYITENCISDPTETCFVNNGTATYKGIEGEGTYALPGVPGLSVFANGALMSSKAGDGKWEPNAPRWTLAGGLLYKQDAWKFSLIDKTIGSQYSDTANFKFYELRAYSNVNASLGYTLGNYEFDVNVDNLFDSRSTLLITEAGSTPQTDAATSLDQYFFQAPRSIMGTIKAAF